MNPDERRCFRTGTGKGILWAAKGRIEHIEEPGEKLLYGRSRGFSDDLSRMREAQISPGVLQERSATPYVLAYHFNGLLGALGGSAGRAIGPANMWLWGTDPFPVNASEEFLGQRDDDARRA